MLLLSFSTLIAIGLAIQFSVDRVFWPIALMAHLSINLIFSFVFAALQTYFKHTVWQSVVLINITAVLLIAIHAMFYLQTDRLECCFRRSAAIESFTASDSQ